MKLVRYADRPDLRAIRHGRLSRRTFPEYMHHNHSGTRYWDVSTRRGPDFQLGLLDDDEFIAELRQVRGGVGKHVEPNVWVVHDLLIRLRPEA
jgi:hypothetical protein